MIELLFPSEAQLVIEDVQVHSEKIDIYAKRRATRSGSKRPFLVSRPLSGKRARVAVSLSPKNRPYTFKRKRLKPLTIQEQHPFCVAVDDRLDEGESDSQSYLSHRF